MPNFLTRLELQGFKSFAPKTEFVMKERIVGIVGPNGSGKSNVIDAIRWVLGEREAKQLRGDVLGNLIFAGTPKKPAASLARVTLNFDNSKKILPVDSEEVALTRRIDRAGNSQFFLNDEEVRLKDVIPMLAKARLGSRGLTIIGQGDSDVFVRINPEERRWMIEEILGLKEYRLKKKTAERRLNKSRTNMMTLTVQIEEALPHLKFLRRQKSKWDKRSEIAEELKGLANKYFSFYYPGILDRLNKIDSEIETFSTEKKKKLPTVSALEKEIDKVDKKEGDRGRLEELRGEMKKIQSDRMELERELARHEARLEFQERTPSQKPSYSTSYLLSLIKSFNDEVTAVFNEESAKIKEVINTWVNKFKKLFENEEVLQAAPDFSEVNKLKKEIAGFDVKVETLRQEEEGVLKGQEEQNYEFRAQIEKLEDRKNELRTVENKIQQLILTKEREQFRLRELESKWQNLGFPLDGLRSIPISEDKEEDPSRQSGAEEGWEKIERRMDRLRSELIIVGEIDETLINEAEELEERYGSLAKELKDLEQAASDLELLIRDLHKKIHSSFKESFGLVNKEFNNHFRLMFGGGKAKLKLVKKVLPVAEEQEGVEKEADEKGEEERDTGELEAGVDIELNLPRKKITSIDMLSGGEKSLVSVAALFALISVSPPPFLILDEIDAALDDANARRFAELIKEFSHKTQFLVVTHNKVTMEIIDALYGVTMGDDGASKVLSMKFENVAEA